MAKNWRESASLIILARNHNNTFKKGTNYNVLLFRRSEKTSFMPNSSAFPGGAIDPKDECSSWLKHFKNFGVSDSRLNELSSNIQGTRPPIFQKSPNSIAKEISLRITAIRETFEEIGILFCRKKDELTKCNRYGFFSEDFDKEFWQKAVHNDGSRFLELCQNLNVVPDVWSLHEWSDWLTPASFSKRRFETAFFLVAVNKSPNVLAEKDEVSEIFWKTPSEYLDMHKKEELWLPPPQSYELLRIKGMPNIDILASFAKDRNSKGVTQFLPVQYNCEDGVASVLPGDSCYPEDPNSFTEMVEIDETLKEFRQRANKLHRNEYTKFYSNTVYCTIEPANNHLKPVSITLLNDEKTSKL